MVPVFIGVKRVPVSVAEEEGLKNSRRILGKGENSHNKNFANNSPQPIWSVLLVALIPLDLYGGMWCAVVKSDPFFLILLLDLITVFVWWCA